MKFPKLSPKVIIISVSLFLIVSTSLVITLLTVIDNVPPTITFTNPLEDDICSGTVSIEYIAEDKGSIGAKVEKVEIYIDEELKSSEGNFIWNTNEYNDGHYTIKAVAFDKSGNRAESAINITVDNFLNPPPLDMFKILDFNIYESGKNPDWKNVVKATNPDIAVFVETGDWDNSDDYLLNHYLNQLNGYFYEEAPYEGYTTQGIGYNTQGEAIFSRYPILDFYQDDNVTLDDETYHYLASDFMHAVVDIQGIEVNIIGYHLKCCASDFEKLRREKETEGLINYMDDLGDVPIIFLGDTNSMSPTDNNQSIPEPGADFGYGPVTMLLYPNDPTYGQYSSVVHNFTDVYRYAYPNDTEVGYTLNILNSHSRIDHIFVNHHFENSMINSSIGSGTEYDETASDHYSVNAFLSITNISSTLNAKVETEQSKKFIQLEELIETPNEIVSSKLNFEIAAIIEKDN